MNKKKKKREMKMKWPTWQSGAASSYYSEKLMVIRLNQIKLEGLCRANHKNNSQKGEEAEVVVVGLKVKWKGGSKKKKKKRGGLFHGGSSWRQTNCTSFLPLNDSPLVQWPDSFQTLSSIDALDLTFTLIHGKSHESSCKTAVLGKASLNLARELGSGMKSVIEAKIPIVLKLAGIDTHATLCVHVSFAEVRNSQGSDGNVQNTADESERDNLIKRVSNFRSFRKSRKNQSLVESLATSPTNTKTGTNTVPCINSVKQSSTKENGLNRCSTGSDSPHDPFKKSGLHKWKRMLSFNPTRRKEAAAALNVSTIGVNDKVDEGVVSSKDWWEVKEVVSRDGEAKLQTPVFFASFDQRSETAAGESACTALVTVIAHWLHSNHDVMPSKSQFDSLITEGSYEWQKLCNNEAYLNFFPNKHFDLETVLEADLRPLAVWPENSFIGFFSPEKFKSLKEAMSFDKIWNEISNEDEVYEPRIYIVSWNDHFFLLKIEADAYYIIDTLGERLFEGCNQAYILKFDQSSVMCEEKKREEDGAGSMNQVEKGQEVICRGKECCREFIKRFLAAIPLGELEQEEQKGSVPNLPLHHRLQIEFHYSYSPPSSSSSSSAASSAFSTPSPPFSNEDCTKI